MGTGVDGSYDCGPKRVMITSIILTVVVVAFFAGMIRLGATQKNHDHEEFARDYDELQSEFQELHDGIADLRKIGWGLCIPIASLMGLVGLVIWALTHG